MKKISFLLLFPVIAFGQYTSIPDSIFEQRLIDFGYDTIHDGQVLTLNIVNVDSLNLSNNFGGPTTFINSIQNLSGIQDFTNLKYLDLSNNFISMIDLSQNIFLEYLNCNRNNLSSLDLDQNILLVNLYCNDNQISYLDLSLNLNLEFLDCNSNQITFLNVSQNTALKTLLCTDNHISYLDLSQNTLLEILNCSGNKLSNLDLSQNTSLTTLDLSNNFISMIDLSQNIFLEYLNCNSNNLSSLDLDQNILLVNLYCYDNHISYLDLSLNLNLEFLDCNSNQITFLNVSQNTALKTLLCTDNHISYLDLSQDTALTSLVCGKTRFFLSGTGNNLSSLDLSQNFNLNFLECSNNPLLNLNLKDSNNTVFSGIRCINSFLTCVSVDDPLWASSNLPNLWLDTNIFFSTNCPFIDIYTIIPDSMFEQKLINLGYDSISDGQVLTSNIRFIDSLDVSNAGITDLTGIEDFTHISYLNINMNELTNFDISQNALLDNLQCRCSGLSSLDITQNPNLTILDCSNDVFSGPTPCQNNNLNNIISNLNLSNNFSLSSISINGNNLTSLDIRLNQSLTSLNCQNNNLKFLDVRNGNNINFSYFNALDNDSLNCIASDDSIWSTLNWINIPNHSFFSDYCSNYYTYIPDVIFEQNLINKGYDYNIDGQVLTANIINIDSLDVSINPNSFIYPYVISDLTGIEDFVNLTYLNCRGGLSPFGIFLGELSNLDLSQNINLQYLDIGFNKLSNLDLSQNTSLTYLNCFDNELSSLDLSQNILLKELDCSSYLSLNYPDLFPQINGNEISILDLSQNTFLEELNCIGIELKNLNLNQNALLKNLNCGDNQLTSLELRNGNNINFTDFNASNNDSLFCISVDDSAWSANNWSAAIDSHTVFSNDCNPSSVDIIENLNNFLIYPNPTRQDITISINNFYGNIRTEVFDLVGNRLKSTNETTISLRDYSKGIYILKVAYGNRVEEVKVIKD